MESPLESELAAPQACVECNEAGWLLMASIEALQNSPRSIARSLGRCRTRTRSLGHKPTAPGRIRISLGGMWGESLLRQRGRQAPTTSNFATSKSPSPNFQITIFGGIYQANVFIGAARGTFIWLFKKVQNELGAWPTWLALGLLG